MGLPIATLQGDVFFSRELAGATREEHLQSRYHAIFDALLTGGGYFDRHEAAEGLYQAAGAHALRGALAIPRASLGTSCDRGDGDF